VTEPWDAPWGEPPEQWNHYAKHGPEVGASTPAEYDASARATIKRGVRPTYRERNGVPRVGYYDRATGLFTSLDRHELRITSHFAASEQYVRGLRDSTYKG
jgi:hypothetical protein